MSGQRREVEVEPITDEKRQTVSDQALSRNVDDRMRHVLRAGIQMEHRQNSAWRSAAGYAARPTAGAGDEDGRRCARAGCARARLLE